MKKILLCLIGCFQLLHVFSQNRNNIWYFGDSTGIDFNTNPPTLLLNSGMYSYEASATISDNSGQLLFYTNGDMVWNRNHTMMPYGFGLAGGVYASATQGAIIVPLPCSSNQYYIFTVTGQEESPRLFCYSIVDLSLDGGLGEVTVKNLTVHQNVTERLTATLQANGIDYWIITQERITGNLLVYSLTAAGLNPVPVIFNTGGIDPLDAVGYIRFSHDGTKLCVAHNNAVGKAILYDFDRATGTVSNPIDLPGISPYGIEFSPDNSKLYISTNLDARLYQYDLSAGSPTDIQNSQTVVSNVFAMYGALKLAPDNKIYVNWFDESVLSIIDQPNVAGFACNVIDAGFSLLPRKAKLGLPNNIDVFSNCIPCPAAASTTMNVSVCANQSYQLPSGTTVSSEGVYQDTIRNQHSCDSIIYTVHLSTYSVAFLDNRAAICSGDSYQLPSGQMIHLEGIYNDTLRNQYSCDSIIYTIHLHVNQASVLNLVDSIYAGESYVLPSGVTVSNAGTYQSILTNAVGCDSIITTSLKLKSASPECLTLKNAFTPNADGINDRWVLYTYDCFRRLSVTVYNRYGSVVYHANEYQNDWDGKYKGKTLPDGTYYYVLELVLMDNKRMFLKGNVSLLR
ncbi:MAG: gliding motility-associated C-terminal domain-containing protein [Ferruginibacter sp.]